MQYKSKVNQYYELLTTINGGQTDPDVTASEAWDLEDAEMIVESMTVNTAGLFIWSLL